MLAGIGVIALYVELIMLVVTGGYAISSLFTSGIVPTSLTLEQALHVATQ